MPPPSGAAARRGHSAAPRFYFSLRSPYSWLAYHDLLAGRPDLSARLEWVPYWEPDAWTEQLLAEEGATFVYTAMSRAKHFYILSDVRRLTKSRGLAVRWPVDEKPVWEVPHLAFLAARRRGLGHGFIAQTYHARWQEGSDICDRSTMGRIAKSLDLSPADLADAADDPALREEGKQSLLAAIKDGVFGVPFFTHGYDKYWGVDRLSDFIGSLDASSDALATVAGPPPESTVPVTESAGGDIGHAGGCG